jgi:ribosomal protein L16 Arg81 hydroxylase
VERFVRDHWSCDRPLCKHAPIERLGALAELEDFADFSRWDRNRCTSMRAAVSKGETVRRIAVDRAQAALLWEVGATLSFNAVHKGNAAVAGWLRAVSRDVGASEAMCHANLYMSPAGAGVAKHFDAHPVIVVQVVGVKDWQIAPSSEGPHPLLNRDAPDESRMPRTSARFTMRPGSALYVPAGYWHQTRARSHSLSLTFGLRTARWLDIAREAFAAQLAKEATWRAYAWRGAGHPARRAELERCARRLADELASPGATASAPQTRRRRAPAR